MKKKILFTLIIIVIVIILFISMLFLEEKENNINDLVKDVESNVLIGKDELKVTYIKGNMLDESISFGNVTSKIIKIENKNDKSISFAIHLKDAIISDEELTYSVTYAEDINGVYEAIGKTEKVNSNNILIYNIAIEASKEIYIKIEFKANYEPENTSLKGILSVENNLSATELFSESILEFQKNLDEKINNLNGITESGYYLININDLKQKNSKYNGYCLIDATDYSDLKFYYTVYNEKYILTDYQLKDQKITKSNLKNKTDALIKNVNTEAICRYHTKKDCLPFNSLKVNNLGGKDVFTANVKKTVDDFKKGFNKTEKKVYISEVHSNGINGYILVNNKLDKPEYYLYLANSLYMVSGYNMTKYGMFSSESTTVRAYNESAFKLSASSSKVVCSFTGFNECYDMNNEKV
ncbi:MAG: hypothetical protein OSJ70_07045 [Bacilli bacterium]|nr:hypothetical protein [Bacilli bacterium]